MGIKRYKPTSPARRLMTVSSFEEITSTKPEKSLLVIKKSKAGRNNQGRITVRHQGGGHKRFYRIIDFKRNKLGIPGRVATVEYDPNRSARIALVVYADGEKRYILAPLGLKDRRYIGAFRTPTLRNLSRTLPYMHDGGKATLADVLKFYNGEITLLGTQYVDPLLLDAGGRVRRLDLAESDLRALELFLRALDGGDLPARLTAEPKK